MGHEIDGAARGARPVDARPVKSRRTALRGAMTLAAVVSLGGGCTSPPKQEGPLDVRVTELAPEVLDQISAQVAERVDRDLAVRAAARGVAVAEVRAPAVRVVSAPAASRRSGAAKPVAPASSPSDAELQDMKSSIGLALDWFARHQSPDGLWSAAGFAEQCSGPHCSGAGEPAYDVGVTGLALLCFLGAGETHQTGAHAANVGRALDRLCALQDAEGCIGKRSSQHFQYNHGYGALALVEAYGLTKSSKLREPAQRAVAFTLKSKNPYLGWRYNSPPDGDNDTSVTGLMVMVLRSAMLAGLEVEDVAFRDARNWIDKMTEPEFGRTGYQQRGGPPARTNEAMTRFPSDRSEALTAVGLSARLFAGEKAGTSEMIGKGAALLAARPPVWDEASGSIDLYYWYWGTLAMSQVGGSGWEQWRAHLVKALPSHQRRDTDRDARGSWDAIDAWSTEGGRVYATAMACLSSEIASRVVR